MAVDSLILIVQFLYVPTKCKAADSILKHSLNLWKGISSPILQNSKMDDILSLLPV